VKNIHEGRPHEEKISQLDIACSTLGGPFPRVMSPFRRSLCFGTASRKEPILQSRFHLVPAHHRRLGAEEAGAARFSIAVPAICTAGAHSPNL
jgi:hypothetical protein